MQGPKPSLCVHSPVIQAHPPRSTQDAERTFLRHAFSQAQNLESRRLELSKQAVAGVAEAYRLALPAVQQELVRGVGGREWNQRDMGVSLCVE